MRSVLIVLMFVILGFLTVFLTRDVNAQNVTFRNGYYINLSGGGADLNGNIGAYNDEADCDPGRGICSARKRSNQEAYVNGNVQKYICSGKVLNCDNKNNPSRVIKGPDYSSVHYIYNTAYPAIQCDQTIQLDVFDANGALHGFMTWYSGACAAAATPTPAPEMVTTCNNRTITRGQLQSELRGANYPGPWGDVNTELAAFNRAACPQATPTPQPAAGGLAATPTPAPAQVTQATLQQTTVVRTVSAQPVVQKTIVAGQSLPQTGLPIEALALTTGLPVGYYLLRWSKKLVR